MIIMARLVKNVITPIPEAVFTFEYADGTKKSKSIREDDLVYVSFIENDELKELQGRVNRILFKRINSSKLKTDAQSFASHYKITGIELDYSETNQAKIIKIDSTTIVEIHGADEEMDAEKANKQSVVSNLVVDVFVSLSDGTESTRTFTIGDGVGDMVYMMSSQESSWDSTITGTVYNITYRITGASDNSKSDTVKLSDTIYPITLYIMTATGAIRMVPLRLIKVVGKEQNTVTDIASAVSAIASAEDGDIIKLPTGELTETIQINKNIVLCGANAGVTASSGSRCNGNIDDETVISSINVAEGVSVYFDGLAFTGDALMNISNSEEISVNNCKIVDVTPTASKTHLVKLTGNASTSVNITNCYFGKNTSVDSCKMYHVFELGGCLVDGSKISNNYFAKECCTQNIINIYDVEAGATISISGNVFEYSANAIRIGMKGNPDCTIQIENNTYYATDTTYPEYAGLFLIQPYGSQTETFENCTIICNNTKRNDNGQLFYLWYGGNDTQITSSMRPTVYVNKKKVMYPVK